MTASNAKPAYSRLDASCDAAGFARHWHGRPDAGCDEATMASLLDSWLRDHLRAEREREQQRCIDRIAGVLRG